MSSRIARPLQPLSVDFMEQEGQNECDGVRELLLARQIEGVLFIAPDL